MAYQNNYDDLLRRIHGSGQSWSDYDLNLARENPDAGMSIFTAKDSFSKAQTDEDRLAANRSAEQIRQRYGGYSAGKDGSGFTLTDKYAPPAQEYTSPYGGAIDDLLDEIMGREPFSYSPGADPSYQAYSEKYRSLGNQARENAMGSAAAMTGGQLSSYALTAGQQAQNTYNAQLSDAIPQLQQLAYEMYLGDLNQKRTDLSTLQGLDDTQYGRYRDQRGDALDTWQLNHGVDRETVADQRYEDEANYTKNREAALTLAAAGNFGALAELWGLDEGQTQALVDDYARQKNLTDAEAARALADWYAQYGDFGKLREQGVNTSYLEKQQAASLQPKSGGSGGKGGGESYKPRLTAAQARAAVDGGSRSPSVLADYEYWFGEPYQEKYGTENAATDKDFGDFKYNLMGFRTNNGRAAQIEKAIKAGKISEEQAVALYEYFGIPLE